MYVQDMFFLLFLMLLHYSKFSWLILQHKKPAESMLMGCSSRNALGDGPVSPKYSDRLSPAINNYLSEASRHEVRVNLLFLSYPTLFSKVDMCMFSPFLYKSLPVLIWKLHLFPYP